MPLFKIKDKKTKKLSSLEVLKERDIQNLFEDNLSEILNIDFLASEFSTTSGGRIDTLGVDKNGSPCIIEYKKGQNDNVINQGLSYLKWLLDHRANFEMLCRDKDVKCEIDWASPRVICVAESYNKFDLDTAEILPIKIELLKYGLYEDDLLQLDMERQEKVRISTAKIYKSSKKEKEIGEKLQKQYTLEDHLRGKKEDIKKVFYSLREKITALDTDIIEEPKKLYIAYKMATNFVDVELRSKDIKIFLNIPSGKLDDPKNIARDLLNPKPVGHWGNGDYEVKIVKEDEIDDTFYLIKQSYNFNK
jgi:predicted transport protein